jgi:hypothetical protein
MNAFSINWRRVGFLVGIGLLVLVIIDLNTRLEGLNNLETERGVYSAKATQAMQTQEALQTQVAYAQSDQAVEDYARGNGRMIQERDIPAVPLGIQTDEPIVTPTPLPIPTPLPNWQTWWDLFFANR